jgi:hypothetical protein
MRTKGPDIFAIAVVALLIPTFGRAENDASGKKKTLSTQPTGKSTTPDATVNENRTEQPAAPSYEREIEQLRETLAEQAQLIKAQQEGLDALRAELRAERGSSPPQPARESAAQPNFAERGAAPNSPEDIELAVRVAKMEKDLDVTKKETKGKLGAFGPFNFSGDIRLRDEPFFGGPANQSLVRNHERYRLRFNANAKLNDDISGGFSVASGDLNDPISTNQTINQFYTRKAIAVDRAFINYTPHQFKALTLTGGKFAYPWYNTELTWDKDLNPEGVAETLVWNLEKAAVLKKIALVGFELPFAEVAGVSTNNKSIVQSAVYGGQLQTVWELTGWLKFSAYGGFYNYHNADSIAFALATASLASPQTPASGLLKLNQNSVQNSITTITKNTVVTANAGSGNTPAVLPTGVTSIQSAQFASKFGLFDGIARFDVMTPSARWPIAVIGDYVQNTRACANVDNLPTEAPVNTATASFLRTVSAPCNPHQRRGYWLEARYGRAQEQGDWQFAYTRMYIEREAVLGAFNFSEIRQTSNVTQHRVEAIYQAYKNVNLGFTGYFGRPLASTEPFLKRLQFDVLYKF